jgi:hypothetical protein
MQAREAPVLYKRCACGVKSQFGEKMTGAQCSAKISVFGEGLPTEPLWEKR